jgi:hypothetical protein
MANQGNEVRLAQFAIVRFFAKYISALPSGKNRWELTQKGHSLRLNVGPLVGLDACGGTVGMHVKPISLRFRQRLDRLGSVDAGQKSSRWFTRGALWVVVPVEHLAGGGSPTAAMC